MAYINTGGYRQPILTIRTSTNGVEVPVAYSLLDGFISAVTGQGFPPLTDTQLQQLPEASYLDRLDYFLRHVSARQHAAFDYAAAVVNAPYGLVTDASAPAGLSCPTGVPVPDAPDPDEPEFRVVCGAQSAYQGGRTYPGVSEVLLGPETGLVRVTFEPFSVPDRFVVELGGVVVLDTGYLGNPGYQELLDAALTARGEATAKITYAWPGGNAFTFEKRTADTIAIVKAYAPLDGTVWNYRMECPVKPAGWID